MYRALLADSRCGARPRVRIAAVDSELQLDRAFSLVVGVKEIWERTGIAVWTGRLRDAEGRQGLRRDDPARSGGHEVLRQEWPKRLVFPSLNVARRPVVEQAVTGNVPRCLRDWDRLAERVSRSDPNAELELVVETPRRAKHGRVRVRRLRLSIGAMDWRARWPHRRRSAVIADRDVLVVRQQRVVRPK